MHSLGSSPCNQYQSKHNGSVCSIFEAQVLIKGRCQEIRVRLGPWRLPGSLLRRDWVVYVPIRIWLWEMPLRSFSFSISYLFGCLVPLHVVVSDVCELEYSRAVYTEFLLGCVPVCCARQSFTTFSRLLLKYRNLWFMNIFDCPLDCLLCIYAFCAPIAGSRCTYLYVLFFFLQPRFAPKVPTVPHKTRKV